MKLSELNAKIQRAIKEKGDMEIFLSIKEDSECPTCGSPETKEFCGFCKDVQLGNVNGEICFWLTGENSF